MFGKQLYEIEDWQGIENDKKYLCTSGSSYVIDLVLSGEVIGLCFHSGPCDEDVKRCLQLPEVKAQLDYIKEKDIFKKWWSEFFTDETPAEHATADEETCLSWLLFDCCASASDGYCYEVTDGKDMLIGMDITEVREKLGYWWVLENQRVNSSGGWYQFHRAGHGIVEITTKNNRVACIHGSDIQLLNNV